MDCEYTKISKPTTHMFLPHEAVMTIDILETYTPKSNLHHVAFILGVSRKHLAKIRRQLVAASQGDEKECAEYNSRTPLLRTLACYYKLIDSNPEYIKSCMEDAKRYSDPAGNVLHARGKEQKALSGIDQQQRKLVVAEYDNYNAN